VIGEALVAGLEAAVRAIVRDELERAAALGAGAELVTVAAYAKRCSLSQSTVRAAIADGRLEAVKIGRAVRIPATASIARPVRNVSDAERRALELVGVRSPSTPRNPRRKP